MKNTGNKRDWVLIFALVMSGLATLAFALSTFASIMVLRTQ